MFSISTINSRHAHSITVVLRSWPTNENTLLPKYSSRVSGSSQYLPFFFFAFVLSLAAVPKDKEGEGEGREEDDFPCLTSRLRVRSCVRHVRFVQP